MIKINLEKQLSEFYSTLDYNPLSANAISIYLILLQVARKTGWSNKFSVANTTLMSKIKGLNLSALQRARNELINAKFITYKRGVNQAETPTYQLVELNLLKPDEQAREQADEQALEQAREQADEHYITKLNLFYDYIIKGKKENADGFSEKDRQALICLLKRFHMYLTSSIAEKYEQDVSSKALLDYKIQIWAIKELYRSPYKAGFNTGILNYEKIAMKYLKTQKYICSKKYYTIKEVIDYFIACLQGMLENC